jgi:hypothetical protein
MSLGVVVSGMVAGVPGQGGATWAVLQYLLGLRRLGHRVTLVEPVDHGPGDGALADSTMAAYCEKVMTAVGLDDDWALLDSRSGASAGLDRSRLQQRADEADVLLNVSGMLADEALLEAVPVRAYLDLDPAFNQLWHDVEGIDMRFDGHTHFVTVGLSLGTDRCSVPTCGRRWITTLPPVVLDQWPVAEEERFAALTTVGNFRGYGSISHGSVLYGQKAHSFRPLADLPVRTGERFLLALAIHADEERDLALLRANRWELVDPAVVAGTPDDYRSFVQASHAEFGLAKSGYVVSRSGWFSDRSACYLASGRPVVAQDTGFPAHVPTGEGLLSFAGAGDVEAAVESLHADYEGHRRAARALAEEHLDSDRVLGRLLDELSRAA